MSVYPCSTFVYIREVLSCIFMWYFRVYQHSALEHILWSAGLCAWLTSRLYIKDTCTFNYEYGTCTFGIHVHVFCVMVYFALHMLPV